MYHMTKSCKVASSRKNSNPTLKVTLWFVCVLACVFVCLFVVSVFYVLSFFCCVWWCGCGLTTMGCYYSDGVCDDGMDAMGLDDCSMWVLVRDIIERSRMMMSFGADIESRLIQCFNIHSNHTMNHDVILLSCAVRCVDVLEWIPVCDWVAIVRLLLMSR